MKKNFLLSLGMFFSASLAMNAQNVIFSEDFSEPQTKPETEVGWYEFINTLEDDEREVKDGVLHFYNSLAAEGSTWQRAVKFRNLPLKENASYRVSMTLRGDNSYSMDGTTTAMSKARFSLQQGTENVDMAFLDNQGNSTFLADITDFQEDAVKYTAMFYYTTDAAHKAWWEANGANDNTLESKYFLSVNVYSPGDYYIDDIVVEEAAIKGITFRDDVVNVDFGYPTNIADLVKATGAKRIMFPNDCVSVKVNDAPATVLSVEGFADGKFYIFIDENYPDSEDAKVEVTFTNPTDPAYRIAYASAAASATGEVPNFTAYAASYDGDIADVYSYAYETPVLMKADPEDGSFNLPLNISEFKLTFDKVVDCSMLEAKLGGEALAVAPAEGFAQEITLTRPATDLAAGEYILNITKIFPERMLGEDIFGEENITLNIGPVNADPNDTVRIMVKDTFLETITNNGEGTVPMGWSIYSEGNMIEQGTNPGSGPRTFKFADGGDMTGTVYFRLGNDATPDAGRVIYGETAGYELTLEAGKKYVVHYNVAAWKGTPWAKFYILDAEDNIVYERCDAALPNMNGAKGAIQGATNVEFQFRPTATGNYKLKWTPAINEAGEGGGWVEVILGNVLVKYLPNAAGVEETQILNVALENAKTTLAGNSDERYAGPAYDALKAAIEAYDGKTYTAPSAYKKAAAELDAAAKAMKDHRTLCDTYDPLPLNGQTVIDKFAGTKFAATTYFTNLKTYVEKYTGQVLTNDAELQVAIDELTKAIDLCNKMFTEGESKTTGTGYAVLNERIRLGIATAIALGVAEDNADIVEAKNVLGDDDKVADGLKLLIKNQLYGQLKNADNKVFEPVMDTITLETIPTTYDMSVFIKNPNLYTTKEDRKNLTQDNAPGWNVTQGDGYEVAWTTGWSQVTTDEIPGDAMLSNWARPYDINQTITDLPAGVYSVKVGLGERESSAEAEAAATYFYVQATSLENGADSLHAPVIGQVFPYANMSIDNVVVTDGQLTIGVKTDGASHTFFNEAKLFITAAAAGFDYGKAYDEVASGIDVTEATPANVIGIELYDLNGRRVDAARQGIVLVKKYMSDGTIRTEKVVKK